MRHLKPLELEPRRKKKNNPKFIGIKDIDPAESYTIEIQISCLRNRIAKLQPPVDDSRDEAESTEW